MADRIADQLDEQSWGSFFSRQEREFLIAICDRLIPDSTLGPGAIRAGVPQFIDRHMATPYARGDQWYRQGPFTDASHLLGYQGPMSLSQILREGIRETEEYCQRSRGRAFAEFSLPEMEEVIRQLERGELDFATIESSRFFAMLLAEVRIGYFSDPIHGANADMGSWAMIGYPGYPVDYREAIRERAEPHDARPRSIAEAGR
jgi:gluconate 2-dehydrogenase gamma chain